MVHLHDDEEPHYDDATIRMELQQFIDEWHHRILHSGLALSWERKSCLALAIGMFEMHGMECTQGEKDDWCEMEDEAEMVALMVNHIPMPARKTFEHFVLQLQLVVSTTTQVRHALDEGLPEEVARCFEGGDTGPGQQILKQAIVEAGKQIHESVEMHKSWKANTEARIVRLMSSMDEAEHYRQQLEAVQAQLSAFRGEQSNKSKSVLVGMADKNDKVLVHTIFSTWLGWLLEHKMNKDIHDMFKKEISDAEDALTNFKMKQLHISRGMIGRAAAGGDSALVAECLRKWYSYVIEEGHTRSMDAALEEAQKRFGSAQQSAKDASKSVMTRMSAGNDHALTNLCFQSWIAAHDELLKDKEIDALAKAQEGRYKEFMEKKSGEARGVLDRMSAGSDTGLLHLIIEGWVGAVTAEKEQREIEKVLNGHEDRFKSLNLKQKGAAKSVASKCHMQEEENTLMVFFYSWATETREQHVVKHYEGKLDQKKQQLDSVQTMFRSFANQLEQGIGNTPRSQRKSQRSKAESNAGSAAAALPPPAAA